MIPLNQSGEAYKGENAKISTCFSSCLCAGFLAGGEHVGRSKAPASFMKALADGSIGGAFFEQTI
jgi:hypothetical protein